MGQDQVGDYQISTVFTGMNQNFHEGQAFTFETMVFTKGSELGNFPVLRYPTWESAEKGHQKMIEMVKEKGA